MSCLVLMAVIFTRFKHNVLKYLTCTVSIRLAE